MRNGQAWRAARKRERLALRTGRWGDWEDVSHEVTATATRVGWLREVDRAWRNRIFSVLARDLRTEWGVVTHLAIRNTSSTDIPWRYKQRIKDEILGRGRVAVEVFPAVGNLVDGADMYHLWVLPAGKDLPFGLKGSQVGAGGL